LGMPNGTATSWISAFPMLSIVFFDQGYPQTFRSLSFAQASQATISNVVH
jgi:hypothetical protein